MKTRETTPGKTYSVHTSSGCTVSDKNGWQKTIDAPEGYFTAHAGEVTIDGDDAADIRELFKLAPQQQLALLGVLGGKDGLPAGYTRLAYLESTGRQYIKTGILPTGSLTTRITILARVWDGINNTNRVFGSSLNEMGYGWSMNYNNGYGAVGQYFYGSQEAYLDKDNKLDTKYDFVFDKNTITRNGKPVLKRDGKEFALESFEFTQNDIWLFSSNSTYNFANSKVIYSFSVADGKDLLVFSPALDPTGAPCMYDTVSKTPFYNSGTGAFVAGIETQVQLNNMLRKLPDRTGLEVGTLQVRLAAPLQTESNFAALDAMVAKNWEISQAA